MLAMFCISRAGLRTGQAMYWEEKVNRATVTDVLLDTGVIQTKVKHEFVVKRDIVEGVVTIKDLIEILSYTFG